MTFAAGAPVVIVLASLSLLHVFWAVRRAPVSSAAVPEVDGQPALRPGPLACLVVAALLAIAAAGVALAAGLWQVAWVPAWMARATAGGAGLVFALRAVGDFRLVGFFKRVRGTRFARLDSRYYCPLCVLLALGCGVVAVVG